MSGTGDYRDFHAEFSPGSGNALTGAEVDRAFSSNNIGGVGVGWPFPSGVGGTAVPFDPYTLKPPVSPFVFPTAFDEFCRCPEDASVEITHVTTGLWVKRVLYNNGDEVLAIHCTGGTVTLSPEAATALMTELST